MQANVVCFTGTGGGGGSGPVLAVQFLGGGTGSVTFSPSAFSCQSNCGVSFPSGKRKESPGNIQGRIVDAQKAAIPDVTVTAKSASTGFTRTEVSDAE